MSTTHHRPNVEIEHLLNRRSDLSTFLVHLTKDSPGKSAKDNLVSILESGKIEARSSKGWGSTGRAKLPQPCLDLMKVVCFSETPLEHIYSLYQPIRGRDVNLASYGLAFARETARDKGANPVWYVDMTPGRDWVIARALDALRAEAAAAPDFGVHPASRILPFVEGMGDWGPGSRKEFSWEREWRHLGHFMFSDFDIALVLCPEEDIDEFERTGFITAVDPSWSLERMIASIVKKRASLDAAYDSALATIERLKRPAATEG